MKTIKFYLSAVLFLTLIILSCSSDYTKSLGNGYYYRHEGDELNDIYNEKPNPNGREIPANVVAYDFDDDFIIAKQKPKLPQDPLYDKDYKYDRGDKEFYYWIIIHKKKLILGPLDFDKYKLVRKENNVPEDLILK